MGYFNTFLKNNSIDRKNIQLWKYALSDNQFNELLRVLRDSFGNGWIDPRDAILYYAEWWRRNYNGGKPSKEMVFASIGGRIQNKLDANHFYKLAKRGAEILGIEWIVKQNTLYFRTLLLQGGLPIKHISENENSYKKFLLAVLDEQPESIEDFIFLPEITKLLPSSSRNDVIYENCFEIVKAILNDDTKYDILFSSNDKIEKISEELKIKKKTLKRRDRISKPKNYWIFHTGKNKISLRLGLADKYSPEALTQILGFEAAERNYQFYLNDELICIFRKMLSGNYKTDWHNQFHQEWNNEVQIPSAYVIVNEEKHDVRDFIQYIPDLNKPTLWAPFADNEWRMVKSTGISSENGLLLFPKNWTSELEPQMVYMYEKELYYLEFEGEVQVTRRGNFEVRYYKSNVSSFDWTIISHKPDWILQSNMPVVRKKPDVLVYNENGELVRNGYKIYARYHAPNQEWVLLSEIETFLIGCIDLKIEKDGVIAYDKCYNIGNLDIRVDSLNVKSASLYLTNNRFIFSIVESKILSIEEVNGSLKLSIDERTFVIPSGIKSSLKTKAGNSKSLFFELESPFKNIALLSKDGRILPDNATLAFKSLYGIRILMPKGSEGYIKMQNIQRNDVTISKEIKIVPHPLISFRDELLRLYYLADSMDYLNKVKIELICGNTIKTYYVSGFTHFLDVEKQSEGMVSVENSTDEWEVYAVPLNCTPEKISLLPLSRHDKCYKTPDCDTTSQFIVISSKDSEKQLMPRFVNTDDNCTGLTKEERIMHYFRDFQASKFDGDGWQTVLTYFNICKEQDIPFSTFDQLRAISRDSDVAAKAFFFFGINQSDPDEYIQKVVPEMEKDLGFCFHWIKRNDWKKAIHKIIEYITNNYSSPDTQDPHLPISEILGKYFQNNNLDFIFGFISEQDIRVNSISNRDLFNLRQHLGERVLNELPDYKPNVVEYYGIPSHEHKVISLLIKAPIAVAESILELSNVTPIWGGDEFRERIRRNIQYAQYLAPSFYNNVIQYVLSNNQAL
ncbi:hypothetical protein SAMN05216357_1068 [Porphyromonadaceae bacterium KH3CP3RA]|nr:hypothetical protein SAMN05216357_1068 [Porphyromonadaceae bacterium KH3CP3RA]